MSKSKDPEVNAIAVIVARLLPFDFATRERMLRYVQAWAVDPDTQAPPTTTEVEGGEDGK